MTEERPPISFNLEVEGYGLRTFPVIVEYDTPTGQWASYCEPLGMASSGDTLERAIKDLMWSTRDFLVLHKQHGQLDRVMRDAGYEPEVREGGPHV